MAIVINGQTGIDAGHLPINNAGNTEVEGTLTAQGQNVSPFSGFKNYIINGNFDVWQRGTSFAPAIGGTYTADRWIGYGNSSMVFSQGSGGLSSTYLNIAYTNGQTCAVGQRLEISSLNVSNFSNKTFTMSWKSYFNVAPIGGTVKYGVILAHAGGTVDLLSGNLIYTQGLNSTSVTFSFPDLSGYTFNSSSFIEFRPFYNLVQNNIPTQSLALYKVQLEEGSVATPFENRPYGLELSLCQRYALAIQPNQAGVWLANGLTNTGTSFVSYFPFPNEMRTAPTLSTTASSTFLVYGGTLNAAPSAIGLNNSCSRNATIYCTVSGGTTGQSGYLLTNSATSQILFTSEL